MIVMKMNKLRVSLIVASLMAMSSSVFAINISIAGGVSGSSNKVYVGSIAKPLSNGKYSVNWSMEKNHNILCVYNVLANKSYSYQYQPAIKYPQLVSYQKAKGWTPLRYNGFNNTPTPMSIKLEDKCGS